MPALKSKAKVGQLVASDWENETNPKEEGSKRLYELPNIRL